MEFALTKNVRLRKRLAFLYFFMVFFVGCGSSDENKVNFAITEAEVYLSDSNCLSAITSLESVGNQPTNSRYLQTMASAYSCKASHSTLGVFSDLKTFSTNSSSDATKRLGWLSVFSTASLMTTGDDIDFLNLQTSIDTLLYAGGLSTSNNPSTSSRAGLFSTDDALDINVHLFYMIMDQLSRFSYYYGCYNGSTGVKGITRASPATCTNDTNECFANYPNVSFAADVSSKANINAFLTSGGLSGGCQSRAKGHTDLAATDLDSGGHYNSSQVSALCRGVVLMNNLRTVLDAISTTLGNIPGFDSLSTISDLFNTAEGYGNTAGVSDVMSTLSQAKCEADFGANDNGKNKLAIYFVLFFETLFV